MSNIPPDRILLEINAEITAKIDVLVEEGLYSSQAAFIEQAIESQLAIHQATFDKYEKKKVVAIGLFNYSAQELEKFVAENKKAEFKVIGILRFEDDITPELFDRAVAKINLAGRLHAPEDLLPLINERRYTLLGKPYTQFRELNSKDEQKKLPE